MHFHWHEIDNLTAEFIEHWRDLGCAASTANIYLMPEFMLPAIRHLEVKNSPKLAVIWNADYSAMLALVAFNAVPPSWRFPFWRLCAVKSKHSFQTGVLLRSNSERQALDRLFNHLLDGPWRSFQFEELRENTILHQLLQDFARRRGLRWFIQKRYERAGMVAHSDSHWRDCIGRSRRKRLRCAHAQLSKLGKLETRITCGDETSDATIEQFSRLESLGWKAKSSLLATQEGRTFYKEVTDGCRAQGMLLFCELLLDGEVIASTMNFCIKDVGFAFKTGMDPAYAKYCPGYLVEYGFLESWGNASFRLREIESGAQAGCYIEELWPARITMVSGNFVAGALPSIFSALKQAFKHTRHYLTPAQPATSRLQSYPNTSSSSSGDGSGKRRVA